MDRRRYALGMIVQLRKPHPCGTDRWEITRTGIDFGLKCLGCGHRIMIPRAKFERAVKAVLTEGGADSSAAPGG
ncbi:MAG: DUF951 domain-containing protein [Actinomycetia bacterium]|nr:DUF951 domain-containing protein [Actinomycetes bacterium]